MKYCVLIWRDQEYVIVTFDDATAMHEWISTSAPYGWRDDPRWQVIVLADPGAPPKVLTPEAGAKWAKDH